MLAKVEEQKSYIRKLEYDNAELVADRNKLTERVKFLATNPPKRPNSRYRNRGN